MRRPLRRLLFSLSLLAIAGTPAARAADHRFELRTGVPVILVEEHGLPIVHVSLHFSGGPAFDPPGKEGLTALTNRMLMRGTAKRGRAELEEAIESLGTELYTGTQTYATSLAGTVLRRNLEPFLALVGEVLTEPSFPEGEVEKVKREMAAELEAARDDDGTLAAIWFRKLVYPGHPYGHITLGSARSLEGLTRQDVAAHYARFYTRENVIVGISGAVKREEMQQLLDTHLAGLPTGAAADWNAIPKVRKPEKRRVVLVDKGDRSQVQLLIGHPALPADDPDAYAIQLATTAFGGTFTARLMEEVRVKRGWSYGAYARLGAERVAGYYTLSAAPAQTYADQTLDLMLNEYRKFIAEGLTDEEIEFARGYLVNSFAFSIETPSQRVGRLVQARLLGRPDDYVDTFVQRIKALTTDEVRDAVRRHLDADNLVVVMVCTAPPLRDKIAAIEGVAGVTLRPYTEE